MYEPDTEPEFYPIDNMTRESKEERYFAERRLKELYERKNSTKNKIESIKIHRHIEYLERALFWQGANPKEIDFNEIKEHMKECPQDSSIEREYFSKIRNRASAIRAYCLWCQGGSIVGIRECPSVTCPLHPFRMGRDPIRGYDLPKVEIPDDLIEDDLITDDEEGDEDDD